MKTTVLSLALVALAAATALAQVPRTINYQGRVADATGPLEGARQMTLAIYDTETGGTALYTESQSVTFKTGVFTVAIGGGTPGGISQSIHFDKQLWLGVKITGFNGGNELSPRFILRASPYALRSVTSDSSALAGQAALAASATTAKHADKADSATYVVAPLTIQSNGKNEALTVLNSGGSGLYTTGAPYATISNGVDSSGRYFVSGESAGSKAVPAAGGYYRDNAPVAWAEVGRNGTIVTSFGIASIAIQASDSSYLITLARPLQTAQITAEEFVPQISPVITVGGLPTAIDQTPVYAYWTYVHNATGVGYDAKSIQVHISAITVGGQGAATTRPFSITIFGRP